MGENTASPCKKGQTKPHKSGAGEEGWDFFPNSAVLISVGMAILSFAPKQRKLDAELYRQLS